MVRLDILAVDDSGQEYNIEVQRNDSGAGARRARYYSSILDFNTLETGDDFEKLPETYVIFITEHDVLKTGLPIYHIDCMIQESDSSFDDGSHIIYVNVECKDDTPLGQLMHDFTCMSPEDMKYQVLADRTRLFKENKKGCGVMSTIMDEVREEGRETAVKKTVLGMLKNGKLTIQEIAEITGLTVEAVKALADQKTA